MEAIRVAAEAYAKPASFRPSYGTAGFRAEASLLPSTVFRWAFPPTHEIRLPAAHAVHGASPMWLPRGQ